MVNNLSNGPISSSRALHYFPDSFHSWNFLSSIGSGITLLSFGLLSYIRLSLSFWDPAVILCFLILHFYKLGSNRCADPVYYYLSSLFPFEICESRIRWAVIVLSFSTDIWPAPKKGLSFSFIWHYLYLSCLFLFLFSFFICNLWFTDSVSWVLILFK